MQRTGNAVQMGGEENAYRVLMGKMDRKQLLGRPGCR